MNTAKTSNCMQTFVIRHSSFVRHSGFVIRRSLILLIACTTPLLCSCQTPSHTAGMGMLGRAAANSSDPLATAPPPQTLPPTAYTGHPGDGFTRPGAVPAHMRPPGWEPPTAIGPPLPRMIHGPWAPPGIAVPWPEQEYLRDGGDSETRVIVRQDWRVDGLDLEDTVAHYDTLDGRTIVEPSNEVCLYAPRFAAVRRVDNVFEGEQLARAGGHSQPIALVGHEEKQFAATNMQPLQPIGDRAARRANIAKQRDLGVPVFTVLVPVPVQDRVKPHENVQLYLAGELTAEQKALVRKAAQAAIVWESNQAVQIILDGKRAQADVQVQDVEVVYRVDEPNNPKLRLCKTASATSALPGEEIEFTLWFDNLGDQPIGNVTILDNLTTRLEYVPESAQSSVQATFSVAPNEGDSLTLRWEITEPLEPGEGGIVRFKCKVR